MANLTVKKMTGDTTEMKELTTRICKDYLHGVWKTVHPKNIVFKHVSGGLSNFLYHIALPDSVDDKIQDEPKEVLIRIYGQTHGEGALEAIITESVIFTLLSERGLGPKLHGIFPGGRIEEYVHARPLLNRELAIPKVSLRVAHKMAAVHSMEVPLHKDPSWLWNTIGRWLKSCDTSAKRDKFSKLLPEVDLNAECAWLKERVEMEKSPVVFCHNDMQEGNILIHKDCDINNTDEPELVIIDFEYCSYNYRAFDIANHLIEWIYDYKTGEYPFFKVNSSNYPTEKQKLLFINEYLIARGSKECPVKLMKEVEVLTLASHFFWTLWAFVNDEYSKIPFGYWEYGNTRLNSYFKLKEMLQNRMSIKRKLDDVV